MTSPKQKIIQKRVKRRERYARMARIRHRKQKNVPLAKPCCLDGIEKCTDSTPVYQYCPGIFFGERNGGIDVEASLLNKDYMSNCVTVIKDEAKLVCVKLCKNQTSMNMPKPEELSEWENRKEQCWVKWANRFRRFNEMFPKFLEKHKEKFEPGYMNEQLNKKYLEYCEKRKQIQAIKPCLEVRVKFTANEDYVSELNYNAGYIETLGYDFEEFTDKILREGIPRIKYSENDDGCVIATMMDNFETLFEKSLELKSPHEGRFLAKGGELQTGQISFMLTGNFVRSKAELSYLIIMEGLAPIPQCQSLVQSLNMPVVKKEECNEEMRKAFLEKYYKNECSLLNQDCDGSVADSGVSTKLEEENNVKREMTEENEDNTFANGNSTVYSCVSHPNGSENLHVNAPSNAYMRLCAQNSNNMCPPALLYSLYNSQLQSYMQICNNNNNLYNMMHK